MTSSDLDIFLATAPGHEGVLAKEVKGLGFRKVRIEAGGVTCRGGWPEVWRANLNVRGASRVTAHIAGFRVVHLAQLDKRARKIAWGEVLRADVPFRVEVTCRKSRIYHSGAAAERIETAIREELGAAVSKDALVCIRARIEDDLCLIGVDTSGELLYKRGHKEAVNKAPMRETMASMFLMQCGYDGTVPVLDPMCGSGTFVIEAAEIAAGLKPGRSRRFAFENLATFDADQWLRLRETASGGAMPAVRFYGSDRDAGAIAMSRANAERAGVQTIAEFKQAAISELTPPQGAPPGLVIVNPPYGTRIGERKSLMPLYRSLGQTLLSRFSGWRVGIITSEAELARATCLPFLPSPAPVSHGGLRVTLFHTAPL